MERLTVRKKTSHRSQTNSRTCTVSNLKKPSFLRVDFESKTAIMSKTRMEFRGKWTVASVIMF